MKQMTRYLIFVLLPFVLAAAFYFLAGAMHGQGFAQANSWTSADTNLLVGGSIAAVIGALLERITRKKDRV